MTGEKKFTALALLATVQAISGVSLQPKIKDTVEMKELKGFGLPHKIKNKSMCPKCYRPGMYVDSRKVMYERELTPQGEKVLFCDNCIGYIPIINVR